MGETREKALAAALAGAALAVGTAVLRRRLRLAQYRREVQERTESLHEADGWTEDGYIRNQDCFYHREYRTLPASGNGCGPVAAFDLRRRAGQDVSFAAVLQEMDAMHRRHAPGPTQMRVMRRYLDTYLPGRHEVWGRRAALAAAERSAMGVFRYLEQKVPHFVAYYRTEDGRFRFFNICDGEEDVLLNMGQFAARHLCGGSVRLLWWKPSE